MNAKSLYLESVHAFQDLPEDDLEDIETYTHLLAYTAGHIFYMPDDPAEVLFILKEGRVQLYRLSPDGRRLVVAVLHPGAIFGHMALVGQRMHQTYAEALDTVTICVWGRNHVEALLQKRPQVALRFLEAAGERLRQAEERLAETTFKRLPSRLAMLLLQLSEEETNAVVVQGYTHQQLADMLGTYRETVTQLLNDFRQKCLVNLKRRQIHLLEIGKLEEIANI